MALQALPVNLIALSLDPLTVDFLGDDGYGTSRVIGRALALSVRAGAVAAASALLKSRRTLCSARTQA